MDTTREQFYKQINEVSCDYNTLCSLFGQEEVDKHRNNAIKAVIDDFYITKEIEKDNH